MERPWASGRVPGFVRMLRVVTYAGYGGVGGSVGLNVSGNVSLI